MKTQSIFIESREWFDKSGGNSYFSSRVQVNGKFVFSTSWQYGYDTQHVHVALENLYKRGYLPIDLATPYLVREAGIDLYIVKYDALKRDGFADEELWSNK